MLALEVHLLTGRYHATPWGEHVNASAPEWPPAPWRVMRALISSWKRLHPEIPETLVEALLARLDSPPHFHLPPSRAGHTRHYVPVEKNARLLLDSFMNVDQSSSRLTLLWPEVTLEKDEETMLDTLLAGIRYLGRAESWCRVFRVEAPPPANARPLSVDEEAASYVRVMCAESPARLAPLLVDTHTMRQEGRLFPVGARWVTYGLDEEHGSETINASPVYNIAVFLLKEPVPRSQTLPLADRLRGVLLGGGDKSPTLTGRVGKNAREDGHRHLHILPEGPPDSPHLDRITLWALEPFAAVDLEAIRNLDRLPRRRDGQREIGLMPWTLTGNAGREDVFSSARVWESYTPYLLSRHLKSHGRDSAQDQIRTECEARGLPEPSVTALGVEEGEYVVRRYPRGTPPGDPQRFRLTFPQPVVGPICLGASAHFGMGRFLPSE